MQQTAQPAPPPSTFEGFLAALTESEKKSAPAGNAQSAPTSLPGREPTLSWSDDALEDDIATFSYEPALRARARYLSAHSADQSLTQSLSQPLTESVATGVDSGLPRPCSPFPLVAVPAAETVLTQAPPASHSDAGSTGGMSAPRDRNLKCASITIRLSHAECTQLHQRAAEAGLTVSAYLRSCTFEVESLRALVKDTMAQLRAATSEEKQPDPSPPRVSRCQGLMGLFTSRHGSQRVARA